MRRATKLTRTSPKASGTSPSRRPARRIRPTKLSRRRARGTPASRPRPARRGPWRRRRRHPQKFPRGGRLRPTPTWTSRRGASSRWRARARRCTWENVRGDVSIHGDGLSTPPRLRRGYSAEANRGDAAAPSQTVRSDGTREGASVAGTYGPGSRFRRGYDADIPRRRSSVTEDFRRGRGYRTNVLLSVAGTSIESKTLGDAVVFASKYTALAGAGAGAPSYK